jgi:protein-disulfide isomerase
MKTNHALAAGAILLAATSSLATLAIGMRLGDTDARIQDALTRHPEYVGTALQALQETAQRRQQDDLTATAGPVARAILKGDPLIPSIGPASATPVVELFDYNCGFCKAFSSRTAEPMLAQKRIRLLLVLTPILGPGSKRMAQFAAAAQIQGRFEQAHRFLILQHAPKLEDADALRAQLVREAGLDPVRFEHALSDGSADRIVEHGYLLAMKSGLTGTPLIYAGGHALPGAIPTEQLAALIRAR